MSIAAGRTEGFILGVALSAFDAAATWLWLSLGLATEANPIMAGLIEAEGLTVAMGIRAAFGLLWFTGFRLLATRGGSRLATPGQLTAIALLGGLAIYHLALGVTLLA